MVRVQGLLGSERETAQRVEFLVDTGAFYTFISSSLARTLGMLIPLRIEVVVADSRRVEVPLGIAYLQLADREGGIPVGVMDVPMPLLGATALEALGLKVDPVAERLEHTRPFGPAAL